jgi:hypothetical protein
MSTAGSFQSDFSVLLIMLVHVHVRDVTFSNETGTLFRCNKSYSWNHYSLPSNMAVLLNPL